MATTINLGKVGLTFGGDYDSSKDYASRTCVFYNHVSWASKKDVPAGIAPGTNDAYWQKVSERGAQGIQGERGPQGNSAFDGTGIELVNNLTEGGEASALSAEQGKILKAELTELESKVDEIKATKEGSFNISLSSGGFVEVPCLLKANDKIRLKVSHNTAMISVVSLMELYNDGTVGELGNGEYYDFGQVKEYTISRDIIGIKIVGYASVISVAGSLDYYVEFGLFYDIEENVNTNAEKIKELEINSNDLKELVEGNVVPNINGIVISQIIDLNFANDIFAVDGRYANGNYSSGGGYNTTGILPIIPNAEINATVYSGTSTGMDMITFFDANKKFISAVKGNEDKEYNSYSGITPDNCRFFAISTQRKDTSSFSIKVTIKGLFEMSHNLDSIDDTLNSLLVFKDSVNDAIGVDFFEVKTDWEAGYIKFSNSQIVLANGYSHTAPIMVKKGSTVEVVGYGQTESAAISLTNAEGTSFAPKVIHTSNSVYTTYYFEAEEDCYISVSKNDLSNTIVKIKNKLITPIVEDLDLAFNGVKRNIVPTWNVNAPLKSNTTGTTKDMLVNSGYLHTSPIMVKKGDIIKISNIFGQTATSLLAETDENETYYLNLIPHTTNTPGAGIDITYKIEKDCYVTVSKNELSNCDITIVEQEGAIDKLDKIHDPTDKGVVYLNGEATTTEILKQINRPFGFTSGTNIKQLVLLHFSDIHASEIELRRILDYADVYKNYLDDVICTGDQVEGEYKDGMAFWNKVGAENVLQVIGNHDTLDLSASPITYRDYVGEPAYNQYLAPYINNWGVGHDGNTSHCYYYKDYTSENVRLVVLDCMGYDDEENSWLSNVLTDAKNNGIHVVLATHFAAGEPDDIPCSFNAIGGIDLGANNILDGRVCQLVKTFKDNGGKFVCYISGHSHKDKFFHPKGYSDQVCVTIAEATCEQKGSVGDVARERGTRSQDLFNLISIDTYQGVFRLFRVGSDYTRLLQHRYTMCWDYVNNKLICD